MGNIYVVSERVPTLDGHEDAGGPDVSVVIPTLNRWDELARLGLRAALSQRGLNIEAIVVDDGSATSPPKSPPFDDPRVRVIRHETNLGVAAARNTGIRAARGAWVAFLDDDDMWAPAKLISVVQAAERAGADFGYSGAIVLDDALRPLRVTPPAPVRGLQEALRQRNVIVAGASNIVARASLLTRSGDFDEEFSVLSDWEMWLRLAGTGRAEAVIEPLVAYRPSFWILEDEPRHRHDYERLAAKHPEVTIDWSLIERWVAYILLRQGRRGSAAQKYAAAGLRHGDLRSLAKAGISLLGIRLVDQVRRARLDPAPDWIRLYT